MRLTHRRRLVITASSVSGLVLAALFVAASTLYRQFEMTEDRNSVRLTALQGIQAVIREPRNATAAARDEVAAVCDADPIVSLAILQNRTTLAQDGPRDVSELRGAGREVVKDMDMTFTSRSQGSYTAIAALPWRRREEQVAKFSTILALLWFPLVGLIAGATALASRATFKPLDELRRQADAAREGGLQSRLQVAGTDEYGAFATSLNGFLDNLEALVKNEEQFVADAAHELRTPLTALRGRIETTLLRDRSTAEYRKALGVVLEEAERLSALVEALLGSATAAYASAVPPLDLEAEVERAQARWLDRFAEAGVGLEAKTRRVDASVTPSEIGSILDNLLANALRASPEGTACRIELRTLGDRIRLAVQDAGPGIPEEIRERIFDRFVRGEESRNRKTGGFGIGLSLCRRIAEGRGGTIGVVPSERGARFELDLPKA